MEDSEDEFYVQPVKPQLSADSESHKRSQRSRPTSQKSTLHSGAGGLEDDDAASSENENEDQQGNEPDEYEVEGIVNHRQVDKKTGYPKEYLIKWKGYSEKHNSWEPASNLGTAQVLLQKYWNAEGFGGRQKSPTPSTSTKKPAERMSERLTAKKDPKENKRKASIADSDATQPMNPPKRISVRNAKKQEPVETERAHKAATASTSKGATNDSARRRSRRLADVPAEDESPKMEVKVTGIFQFANGAVFLETTSTDGADAGECYMVTKE